MTDSNQVDPDRLEKLGIASALIKARNEAGMTQSQLAEESGISRSAIKGYETGRNMPGARELKDLCRVLKVSPNVLLFGVENLFGDAPQSASDHHPGLRLLLGDPERAKKARMRILALSDLLTTDEVASLLHLMHALAVARHGNEVVDHHIVGADLMAGMGVALQRQTARLAKGEKDVDPDQFAADMEDFMARQGHSPKEPPKTD